MFGKSKGKAADNNRNSPSAQQVQPSAVASSPAAAPEAISSISSGLTIVGKITGNGALAIFGHVEGDLQASTVQISDGAQVEGNIEAEELTIGGRFKGTIHANRVKLNSTAVVEGDIFIGPWQSRRMRISRECRDDRKTPSIRRRSSRRLPCRRGPCRTTATGRARRILRSQIRPTLTSCPHMTNHNRQSRLSRDVRYWHKADMTCCAAHVRFWG